MLDFAEVLRLLSISAIITTIALFFCGIPICMDIYRRKGTDEISGVPFLMGLLGGVFWLRYGLLKLDITMITVNVVGVSLFTCYTIFYYVFTKPKFWLTLEIGAILMLIVTMLLFVALDTEALNPLGFVCMTFNIINFGAPLAGLRIVLRKRCCDTLPLPLCTANLLVSGQWFAYGILINDIYVIIPNGCGILLALLQLSLFIIFPMKHNHISPVGRIAQYCLKTAAKEEDVESRDNEMVRRMQQVGEILRKYSTPAKNLVNLGGKMPTKAFRSGSFDSQIASSCSSGGNSGGFTRITEIDVMENEWRERELRSRAHSAPDIGQHF